MASKKKATNGKKGDKKRGPKKGAPQSPRAPMAVQLVTVETEFQGVPTKSLMYQATVGSETKYFPYDPTNKKECRKTASDWVKSVRKPNAGKPGFARDVKNWYKKMQEKWDLNEIPEEKHEQVGALCEVLENLADPFFTLKAPSAPEESAESVQGLDDLATAS